MRAYERERDLDAVKRIWREIGWAVSSKDQALVEPFHEAGHTLVHDQDGVAEAAVHVTPGTIRYQSEDLSLAAVTAVVTSHVARRQGAARRLLAAALADAVDRGEQVAALGIFDQGFYDQLGFGTGPYEHRFSFDPATLRTPMPSRTPVRVTVDDWPDVYACMESRRRAHGAVVIGDARVVQAELGWHEDPFGLGFRDDAGELTHFVFGQAKGENGPYAVDWIGYRDVEQLLELLGVLRSLGDQVHEVTMEEPVDVQLQDLLHEPFRDRRKAKPGQYYQRSAAWWQLRILDLEGCLSAAHFPANEVVFNLDLHDPAVNHRSEDRSWEGTAGKFVVTLGPECHAKAGEAGGLPTLRAGVGPFSRLLFGVRPASVLAATSDLEGPSSLLTALDRTIHLPSPRVGWSF